MIRLATIISLITLTLAACSPPQAPQNRRRRRRTKRPTRTLKRVASSWQKDDTRLEVGRMYEELFRYDGKQETWVPNKLLPMARHQAARIQWTNKDLLNPYRTAKPNLRITFEPVSREVVQRDQRRFNVTYFCKIIDIDRSFPRSQ